jgi:oligosaccharide repeat unit polymerase
MTEINLGLTLIIFITALFITLKKKGYGYLPIFFSCYFLFILIIPAFFHVKENLFPFYNLSYDTNDIYDASQILLIFSLLFWLGFFWNQKIPTYKIEKINNLIDVKKVNKFKFYLIFYSLVLIVFSCILIYGPEAFMVKRSEFDRDVFGNNSTSRELIINSIKAISFASVFFLIFLRKNFNKISFICNLTLVLILFFIINFPLAQPRFVFFSYFIFLFCFFYRSNFKRKTIIFLGFCFGITTIFPYFSHITRGEGDFNVDMSEYYRLSGDFDGFQSIINGVVFVNKYGYTIGNQLFSSLFSFIPRSLWTSKSEPTGSLGAMAAGYDYLNISSPLPIEFYIDFGYLGLSILAFLFGMFLRKIDIFYIYDRKWGLKYIIAVILISMIAIISRGALLAVLNNFYITVFVFSVIYFLLFYKIKIR